MSSTQTACKYLLIDLSVYAADDLKYTMADHPPSHMPHLQERRGSLYGPFDLSHANDSAASGIS